MRILALETTERIGSLAVMEGPRLVATRRLPSDQRTAATFAVGMQDLLAEVDWQPRDLELIAVCSGPGSFTGLRIGVTAAKTLAYTTGAEVVAVNTLEVIALGALAANGHDGEISRLWTVMDAFRGQIFAAQFHVSAAESSTDGTGHDELVTLVETEILEVDQWLDGLAEGDTVTGPMLGKLQDRVPSGVTIVDSDRWSPTAENLGRWGSQRYQAGQRDDLWQLVPNYFRKSAAEELADKKAAEEKS